MPRRLRLRRNSQQLLRLVKTTGSPLGYPSREKTSPHPARFRPLAPYSPAGSVPALTPTSPRMATWAWPKRASAMHHGNVTPPQAGCLRYWAKRSYTRRLASRAWQQDVVVPVCGQTLAAFGGNFVAMGLLISLRLTGRAPEPLPGLAGGRERARHAPPAPRTQPE